MSRLWRTDGRRTDGKWKIGQCSVRPETAINKSLDIGTIGLNGLGLIFSSTTIDFLIWQLCTQLFTPPVCIQPETIDNVKIFQNNSTWEQPALRKSLGHCASCKHFLYPDDASLLAAALGLRPKPFSIRQKRERDCIPIMMRSKNLTHHYSGYEVSRRRRL